MQGSVRMHCVDVNVQVHLSNADSPAHSAALAWLDHALNHGEVIAIPEVVASGFVRVATDRRILARPITGEQAFTFLDQLLTSPRVTMFAARSATYATFRSLVAGLGLRGNDIPDAWIAAVAMDLDASLVTFDRGFQRYPRLRVINPAHRRRLLLPVRRRVLERRRSRGCESGGAIRVGG